MQLKVNGQAMVPTVAARDEPAKGEALDLWANGLERSSGYTQGLH